MIFLWKEQVCKYETLIIQDRSGLVEMRLLDDIRAAATFLGSYLRSSERALLTHLRYHAEFLGLHPVDLWQQFVEEMCGRDYDDARRSASGHRCFAAFKGWAVGRYSITLTRDEALDALGEEWQAQIVISKPFSSIEAPKRSNRRLRCQHHGRHQPQPGVCSGSTSSSRVYSPP